MIGPILPHYIKSNIREIALATYVAVSLLLSIHYFKTPMGAVDSLDFAGCVAALHNSDPVAIHKTAYREVLRDAPSIVVPHMLGTDENTNTAAVRRDRYANADHFVESLPYFSIKPLYIEFISGLHWLGIRMFPAIVLASVLPAFALTLLMCAWTLRLHGSLLLLCVFLLVPEIRILGYDQGPDALSALVLLGSFIFIFAADRLCPGVTLLLASIWIRPDNAVFVLVILAYLGLRGQIPAWIALVLAAIALASPIVIGHYGGSYGWKALYSHTFKYVEMAPGEFTPTFTVNDYVRALRQGFVNILNGSSVMYVVLGMISYKTVSEMRVPLVIALTASAIHFLIYPNFEPRYYALSYALVAIASTVSLSRIAYKPRTANSLVNQHAGE